MDNPEPIQQEPAERPKRRPAARTGPERAPSNALKSPLPTRPEPPATEPRKRTAFPPVDSAKQAVEAAVALAYRVCDEYLDWGEQAAKQRQSSQDRRDAMRNVPPRMNEAAAQWMQMWQSALQMWSGYLAPFMPPGAVPGSPFFGVSVPGPGGVASAPVSVNLDVSSARRTSVAFSLFRPPAPGALKVTLQRQGGLESIQYVFDSPATLRIHIADDQAEGKYEGIVKDSAGGACGEMSLTVGDV